MTIEVGMPKLTSLFEKSAALFTSKHPEYITPKKLFKELDDEFHFVLDPCTTICNPLGIKHFYTEKDDGLSRSWNFNRGSVYINPPYHSRNIIKWVEKAISARQEAFDITFSWLRDCNVIFRLDFNPTKAIETALNNVKGYFPQGRDGLKDEFPELYSLLEEKGVVY